MQSLDPTTCADICQDTSHIGTGFLCAFRLDIPPFSLQFISQRWKLVRLWIWCWKFDSSGCGCKQICDSPCGSDDIQPHLVEEYSRVESYQGAIRHLLASRHRRRPKYRAPEQDHCVDPVPSRPRCSQRSGCSRAAEKGGPAILHLLRLLSHMHRSWTTGTTGVPIQFGNHGRLQDGLVPQGAQRSSEHGGTCGPGWADASSEKIQHGAEQYLDDARRTVPEQKDEGAKSTFPVCQGRSRQLTLLVVLQKFFFQVCLTEVLPFDEMRRKVINGRKKPKADIVAGSELARDDTSHPGRTDLPHLYQCKLVRPKTTFSWAAPKYRSKTLFVLRLQGTWA